MIFFSTPHYGEHDFLTFYDAVNLDTKDKPAAVCALLDVSPATLKRYLSGQAAPPKAAVRLLFHECHFGRAATDSHSAQGEIYARKHANSLEGAILKLKDLIKALESENDRLKQHQGAPGIAANSDRWIA